MLLESPECPLAAIKGYYMEDAPEEAARGSDAIRLDSGLKAESAAIDYGLRE